MNVLETEDQYGETFNSKEECLENFKESYTKPGHPIAFSGVENIFNFYQGKLTRKEIRDTLSNIYSYTIHKENHLGQRNPSYSHFKRYQFQMDLVEIQELAPYNDNVRYLLTCIDTFTRYGFIRMLLDKTGSSVLHAFKSILLEASEPPTRVVFDRGTEFYNKDFTQFCKDNKIIYYSPDSFIHAAYIERFNRTIQDIFYKYMTENETHRFIDKTNKDGSVTKLLPLFLSTYNNRKHRMIGTTPFIAENNPETHLAIRKKLSEYYETIKTTKITFNVGDEVRITRIKDKFTRGYKARFSEEIFKIHEIKTNLKLPMYILSNLNGNEILKGNFYAFELTKVNNDDVYRIEKVLKKRKYQGKNQILVKWKGYDNSHNSWIDTDQVTKKF